MYDIIIFMIKYCYFKGEIVPLNKVSFSVYDLSIIRGYGAFDFFRTYNGKIFYAKEHYDRFKKSLKEIGLSFEMSFKDFEKICYELKEQNNMKECSFRLLMTGGDMTDGLLVTKPNFIILCEESINPKSENLEKGIKLITSKYMRPFPLAKSTCYIEAVRLESKKRKAKATEILFLDNRKVFECATSNIFIIKKGIIYTPHNNILHGITRSVVISLAKKLDLKVLEKDILEKDLYSADEIFITATNKKVLPVVKIDNQKIGNGKVGSLTKEIQKKFEEYVLNY